MPAFLNRDKRCLLFTNLKVAYSTLKGQSTLVKKGGDRKIGKEACILILLRKTFIGPNTYLMVRNPYSRVVSFFVDKFRRHPRLERSKGFENFSKWQDCQELFFPFVNIDERQQPRKVSKALEKVSFESVIRALPEVYKKDPHLRPQHYIRDVSFYELRLSISFDSIIPIENMDPEFMHRKTGVDITQKRNTTKRDTYPSYLNSDTLDIINTLYRKDFDYFGYKRHRTVPDAPVLEPVRRANKALSEFNT